MDLAGLANMLIWYVFIASYSFPHRAPAPAVRPVTKKFPFFLPQVTKSYRCVVHFYSDEFESCKVADHHMKRMAKKYMSTKFVKMDANKAPFFIQKLNIQTLPTLGVFLDGVMVYKQLGFMGISEGGENPNDFPTWRMARVLSAYDGIEDEVDSDEEFPQA